eukprot:6204678-Pleurochrysis_carterae.AAC.3
MRSRLLVVRKQQLLSEGEVGAQPDCVHRRGPDDHAGLRAVRRLYARQRRLLNRTVLNPIS